MLADELVVRQVELNARTDRSLGNCQALGILVVLVATRLAIADQVHQCRSSALADWGDASRRVDTVAKASEIESSTTARTSAASWQADQVD